MIWTGIDPGLRGAIVSLHDTGKVEMKVMPLINKRLDLATLCEYIGELHGHSVWLELIHSIYGTGKGSMFSMGRGLGNIESSLYCNGVAFNYVAPYDWQKEVWLPEDMVYEMSKSGKRKIRKPKPTSLKCAQRLYPHLDLRYGDNETRHKGKERSKIHDGLVDALLIAHYSKLKTCDTKTILLP